METLPLQHEGVIITVGGPGAYDDALALRQHWVQELGPTLLYDDGGACMILSLVPAVWAWRNCAIEGVLTAQSSLPFVL